MNRPEEIRRKAENLYPDMLRAWLEGESFFPYVVPCDKRVDPHPTAAAESVQRLRTGSKDVRGFGYAVEWTERTSRTHGRNRFPTRILFETRDDLLQFLGREREFASFAAAVERIRARIPQLETWLAAHLREFLLLLPDLDGVLEVVEFLRGHPRPGLFARQLPLAVDTKFVERLETTLRTWLDLVLPPSSIRADESHFARRYGLRYAEPEARLRFLDDDLRLRCGSPWVACSVPLHALAETPVPADRVVVVENRVNLLTLPPLQGTLAVGGLGNGVVDLRHVPWLEGVDLWYWGDIDVEGLAILSRLRAQYPHVRSLMMDEAAATSLASTIGTVGNGATPDPPPHLAPGERAAFDLCLAKNLRIEQERIPHEFVLATVRRAMSPGNEAGPPVDDSIPSPRQPSPRTSSNG